MTRLDLSNVTLWSCVWSHDKDLLCSTMAVMCYMLERCQFGQAILFSTLTADCGGIWENIRIKPFTTSHWSWFVNFEAPKHFRMDYAMSVHEDGFMLEPSLWTPEFLSCDYIGAPWADGVVGNSGFSISSRKLFNTVMTFPPNDDPSDAFVCRTHRDTLQNAGIRFAQVDLALRFSTEETGNDLPSFGFHGRTINPQKYQQGWNLIDA